MLGIQGASVNASAGHIMTPRQHRCGEFRDTFDWSSLPVPYLKRIGALFQKNHQHSETGDRS
jgi:hypothetical protein